MGRAIVLVALWAHMAIFNRVLSLRRHAAALLVVAGVAVVVYGPVLYWDTTHWDEYTAAYTDVLTETSTPWAPWYVVPSDHKWVRNLIVSELLTHHLRQLDPKVPAPAPSVAGLRVD